MQSVSVTRMDWGIRNRLSKIIREDGKCVMLAVDHGYFLGPTDRLENPKKVISPLLAFTDSLMLTRGILRTSVPYNTTVPIMYFGFLVLPAFLERIFLKKRLPLQLKSA